MSHFVEQDIRFEKKNSRVFLLLTMMLSIFCIMKVLRGIDTDSTEAGGIWNYISVLYYPIFLWAVIRTRKYRLKPLFVSGIVYIVFAMFSAIANFSAQLNIVTVYEFMMIPYALLVFLTFYLCSDSSRSGHNIILIGYFVCLVLNLISIFQYRFVGAEQAMESDIYFSLGLFPFALQLLKGKIKRIIIILMEFLAVFMVNKRTALISFGVALVAYLLIYSWINEKNKVSAILKSIVMATIVAYVFYKVSIYIDLKYDMNIYNRLFNIMEDGGSGRTDIYQRVWTAFKDSSFVEKLFGHGMNAAGKVGGAGYAHNDFLEVLYNYGVFAFVSVAVFYVSLIAQGIKLTKRRSPYAASFIFSLIIGLFLAMFSYFLIYYTYVTCIMAFWGYVLALEKKRIKALQVKRTGDNSK